MDIFAVGKVVNRLDRCGFFICRKGRINLLINDKPVEIVAGDAFIYMPSSAMRPVGLSEDAEGIMASIDIDYVIHAINRVSSIESILYIRNAPCIHMPKERYDYIVDLLLALWKRLESTPFDDLEPYQRRIESEILKSQGEVALFEVLSMFFVNIKDSVGMKMPKKDRVFYHFIASLYKNFKSERDVAFYAAELGLTARYFSAIVKEKSGNSALQWITHVVIGEIKNMLESTEYSIKEISMMLNFPTQSFLGKYFKQYTGVSPKEYRAEYSKRQLEIDEDAAE